MQEGEDPGPMRFRHSKPEGIGNPQPLGFQSCWTRWLGILTSKDLRCL